MSDLDISFQCMGTTVRIVGASPPRAEAARRYLRSFDQRLSRFRADSELSALNADPRTAVPASALLRAAIRAGIWAAERTEGLVDPTVLEALDQAGYTASMSGASHQSLAAALAAAPPRRPAGAAAAARWREVEIDDDAGVIRRPPGLRLDTGGTGKGLAADSAAILLDGEDCFAVDCGGDMCVGGAGAQREPFDVSVAHPLTGRLIDGFALGVGGVATSGIDRRVWRLADGRYRHHLIDPATGSPAWTGLVGATALAPSALEADVLAKAAVLAGPEWGREILLPHGGILFHESGRAEYVGPARRRVVTEMLHPMIPGARTR